MSILNKIDSYIDQCFEMQDLNTADSEFEDVQLFEQSNALVAHERTQRNTGQSESLIN